MSSGENAMPSTRCHFTDQKLAISRSRELLAIEAAENLVEKQEADFWERQRNLAGVKRFVLANLPTFDEDD